MQPTIHANSRVNVDRKPIADKLKKKKTKKKAKTAEANNRQANREPQKVAESN